MSELVLGALPTCNLFLKGKANADLAAELFTVYTTFVNGIFSIFIRSLATKPSKLTPTMTAWT